jgi:predicted DCC family thiol-disulfide oxidoreductase YuxK
MVSGPIILYDGECAFCSRLVVFVVERDDGRRFRFASLQSAAGRALLERAGLPTDHLDTLVLIEAGRLRTKSGAALAIASRLGRGWPLVRVFMAVPAPLRDLVYDGIARYRHRLLSSSDRCILPSEMKGRMLEEEGLPG